MLTRPHTTLIVAVSFGAILALGGLVTLATTTTIDHLQSSIATMSEKSRSLDDSIQSLRSEMYISSIILRDSLLDTSSSRPFMYQEQLHEHRRIAMKEIDNVVRLASPTHRTTVESLVRETRTYWESVMQALAKTGTESPAIAYEYIRTTLIPRRQAVMTVTEELADLQAAETTAAQQRLARTLEEFRNRIAAIRAVAAGIVALVALLCTWRVYRLQKVAAVEHARRNQAEGELRQLTQKLLQAHEDERRSLSRELHDHVGQMMTALRFRLGGLEAENPKPTPAFRAMVEESRSLLEGSIEAIRNLAMGLRPAMLDDLGMNAAIEWHAREFSKRFDIPVSLNVADSANSIPEPHRTYVYRILQESLTNCARHARATSVHVNLECADHLLSLSVKDNGVGLSDNGNAKRGFGLTGIEERVRELRGTFAAYTRPEGGTVIEVSIPIPGVAISAKA